MNVGPRRYRVRWRDLRDGTVKSRAYKYRYSAEIQARQLQRWPAFFADVEIVDLGARPPS